MPSLRKYVVNPPRVPRRFKAFKKVSKSIGHLQSIIKNSKPLRKTMKAIFNKTTFKYAAVTTAVGVGAYYIDNYIQSNSGCFLKSGSSTCKVKEFSCCQKDRVSNVPFCDESTKFVDTCNGFSESKEKSCCRLCDCKNYGCLPHQRMECRRPTIDEALAYYGQNISDTFWDFFKSLFPNLYWYLGFLGIAVGVFIALSIYQKTR